MLSPIDIGLLLVIGAAVLLAIRSIRKHPPKCSGNCAGCSGCEKGDRK